MKTKFLIGGLLMLLAFTPTLTCSPGTQTVGFQSISTTEIAVSNANKAFLDAVVSGNAPTNDVPVIEAAFNDVQTGLTLAAVVAKGGAQAAVPADLGLKAQNFINRANSTRK